MSGRRQLRPPPRPRIRSFLRFSSDSRSTAPVALSTPWLTYLRHDGMTGDASQKEVSRSNVASSCSFCRWMDTYRIPIVCHHGRCVQCFFASLQDCCCNNAIFQFHVVRLLLCGTSPTIQTPLHPFDRVKNKKYAPSREHKDESTRRHVTPRRYCVFYNSIRVMTCQYKKSTSLSSQERKTAFLQTPCTYHTTFVFHARTRHKNS